MPHLSLLLHHLRGFEEASDDTHWRKTLQMSLLSLLLPGVRSPQKAYDYAYRMMICFSCLFFLVNFDAEERGLARARNHCHVTSSIDFFLANALDSDPLHTNFITMLHTTSLITSQRPAPVTKFLVSVDLFYYPSSRAWFSSSQSFFFPSKSKVDQFCLF